MPPGLDFGFDGGKPGEAGGMPGSGSALAPGGENGVGAMNGAPPNGAPPG
jgi:hypothetical protein